ncbi:MAG: hypothetical protein ACOYOK_16075, partial [Pseudobdellovibrionaceae bacterium]
AQDLLDNGYSPESVQQIVAGQSALGEWMQKNKLAFDFKKANSAQHFANQLATVPGINGEYIQFVTTGAIPSIVTQQQ